MNIETQPALKPDEAAQAAALVVLLVHERAADIAETLNDETPGVAAAVLLGRPGIARSKFWMSRSSIPVPRSFRCCRPKLPGPFWPAFPPTGLPTCAAS
jgi:hypothetical protein